MKQKIDSIIENLNYITNCHSINLETTTMENFEGRRKVTSKAIIIFGGTGDLSYRKLYPALYDLYKLGKLSQDFKVLGIGRRDYNDKEYSEIIRPWVKKFSRLEYKDEEFESFCGIIKYYMMDFSDEEKYNQLGDYLGKNGLTKDIICYYAVSPEYFMPITTGLSKIVDDIENIKIIIELSLKL